MKVLEFFFKIEDVKKQKVISLASDSIFFVIFFNFCNCLESLDHMSKNCDDIIYNKNFADVAVKTIFFFLNIVL